QTWHDRINVFGGVKPLDIVFAEGPDGFISRGLTAYLDAIGSGLDDFDDADEDDEEDEADDIDGDREAFEQLARPGGSADFQGNYGIAMPAEVAALSTGIEGYDKLGSFEELRLDRTLWPDVGEKNLFELLVRRDQCSHVATGLVEAFC